MSRTFSIGIRNSAEKLKTISVSVPKNGITESEVTSLTDAYDELFGDNVTVRYAKYVDTSETYVIPLS